MWSVAVQQWSVLACALVYHPPSAKTSMLLVVVVYRSHLTSPCVPTDCFTSALIYWPRETWICSLSLLLSLTNDISLHWPTYWHLVSWLRTDCGRYNTMLGIYLNGSLMSHLIPGMFVVVLSYFSCVKSAYSLITGTILNTNKPFGEVLVVIC